MNDAYIVGIGQTPVTRGLQRSVAQTAGEAITRAIDDAGIESAAVSALYLGNMTAGVLERQQQLASLCAHACGLTCAEAFTLEASSASGAAALRTGYMAVAGGFHDAVVVCGAERLSHAPREASTQALTAAFDREETRQSGESFLTLNAALMRRYLDAYHLSPVDLAPFAINAHRNGRNNPNALLRKPLDLEGYLSSRVLLQPLRLMDAPPICDGAAAVVLAGGRVARGLAGGGHAGSALEGNDLAGAGRAVGDFADGDLAEGGPAAGARPQVRILASAVASGSLKVTNFISELKISTAEASSRRALRQAGMRHDDIDILELHDAYTVITALSLESNGFAAPGEAVRLGKNGALALDGRLPVSTMGGLKSRGHPVGATGMYQVVEAVQQLRGMAGANQVRNAAVAMTQNLGGMGATAVTHVLEAT